MRSPAHVATLAVLLVLCIACGADGTNDACEGTTLNLMFGDLAGVGCPSHDGTGVSGCYAVATGVDGKPVVGSTESGSSALAISLECMPTEGQLNMSILCSADDSEPPCVYGKLVGGSINDGQLTSGGFGMSPFAAFSPEQQAFNTPPGASNLAFATASTLPDGRVLIAGGLRKTQDDGDRWLVSQASDLGYIFDPHTNGVRQINTHMNKGRGLHSAIYLPSAQKVLLVGGLERIALDKKTDCFPWHVDTAGNHTIGRTYEVFDALHEEFLQWDSEKWTDADNAMMQPIPRILPTASLLDGSTVLVTGGSTWPSCKSSIDGSAAYLKAELYRGNGADGPTGFVDPGGELTMVSHRTGHTTGATYDDDGVPTPFFWGGSKTSQAELLFRTADGLGQFQPVVITNPETCGRLPFFHSMTPLKNNRFLVAGGVNYEDGGLAQPSADDTWVVTVDDNMATVEHLGSLGKGRYFHGATSHDSNWVVLFGGFGAGANGAGYLAGLSEVRFASGDSGFIGPPKYDTLGPARGAHAAALLPNDCVMYVGGFADMETGLEFETHAAPLSAQVYCPSILCPAPLWDGVCNLAGWPAD